MTQLSNRSMRSFNSCKHCCTGNREVPASRSLLVWCILWHWLQDDHFAIKQAIEWTLCRLDELPEPPLCNRCADSGYHLVSRRAYPNHWEPLIPLLVLSDKVLTMGREIMWSHAMTMAKGRARHQVETLMENASPHFELMLTLGWCHFLQRKEGGT